MTILAAMENSPVAVCQLVLTMYISVSQNTDFHIILTKSMYYSYGQ